MHGAAAELQHAIDNNDLALVYQAQVDLSGDHIVGAEALLRWVHPTRGTIPPLDFIPLAETTGLIVPIGAWVIAESCRRARRWMDAYPGRPPLMVAVNVSVSQFGPDLVDVVTQALQHTAVPAGCLCLEITESILMADVDAALTVLRALAAVGVRVSIDDFGTGFSSLAYLKRFPLDELKIDKSFVDGLGQDPHDTAIVAAIVAMAHALDLVVVAEGVETRDQLDRLRTLGCDAAQGYYLARPVGSAAFEALLNEEAARSWVGHAAPEASGEEAKPGFRPDRVLVVDDTAEIRQLAAISLSAHGFDVHQASDGASALALACEVTPDCVILDVSMPGISGLEVCASLRRNPVTSECTILMLTSNDAAADKARAFSGGADDYIMKPFSPRDLVTRVRAAMRRRHEARHTGPLDASALAGLRELEDDQGSGSLDDIVAAYLDDTRVKLGSIRSALGEGDFETLEWIAHSLRGNSASLGAGTLTALCADLEGRAAESDRAGAYTVFEQMGVELCSVDEALRAAFPGLDSDQARG